MKLGFVTLLTNKLEGTELLNSLASQQANVDLVVEKAPDLLKVPAASKKLFYDHSVDAVLVFIQSAGGDADALALVHEKIIDVEISCGKYVFFAIVGEDEWRDDSTLEIAAERRMGAALRQVLAAIHDIPSPPAAETPASMDMFSGSSSPESTENTAADLVGLDEGGVRSLF